MGCPLCNHNDARASWLGSTFYKGKEFNYAECLFCKSLYCRLMPDKETLGQMYGPGYKTNAAFDSASDDDAKQPHRIIEWLKKERPGTFIDYGCGEGELLIEATKLGWQAMGVEFDSAVAAAVEERTGVRVTTPQRLVSLGQSFADVLHLGDVIEHLTELDSQLPEILRLIKPGGLLLAQGPLEGNANLFNLGLRLARLSRPTRKTEVPPYHVMLATAKGQRILFERFGLEEFEFCMREVSWPAANKLSSVNLRQPRSAGLFLLRRASQAATMLRPKHWGNRYFYVGRYHTEKRGKG